ncbi:ribosome maturation factor RimM [Baileyella intestinalis]|uniref:ribosome maturation factor RimM n=1 Tax=Baileyella intestinalis TaxID=2606709 RepID=UPI003A85659A
MEDRKFVRMGRFTSSVGLKGEMKVTLYNEETVNFKKGAEVYLDVSGGKKPFTVRSVRNHNGTVIAALEGVADRNASDSLRNTEFFMDEEDLEELPEGYHYVEDLIGMKVYDLNSAMEIGTVKDILTNTPQEIYVVEREDAEDVMIPAVENFVREIDTENEVIKVALIPGFLD